MCAPHAEHRVGAQLIAHADAQVVAAPIDEAGVICVGRCGRSAATSSTLVSPSPTPANSIVLLVTVSHAHRGAFHQTRPRP